MAVALHPFSIREYAAGMRSVSFDNCWPFAGAASKSLPPISVRKFRWWSDELKTGGNDASADDDDDDQIPTAKNTPSRLKQKTPKKRSIVELFAVAPPIEAAATEEDEEEEMEGDDAIRGAERREKIARKRKKRKKMMMSKIMIKRKVIKRKINKAKIQIPDAKKDKINRPTFSVQKSQTVQGPMHKLLSDMKSKNPVDNGKKPVYLKNLAKNRKLKLLKSSKPISKKKREPGKVLCVRDTLENSSRDPIKSAGTKTTTQGGNFVKLCCASENHTTRNDIMEHGKSCSPIDIPQLRSLCKIFSDVLAASSVLEACKGDNVASATEMAQADNGSDVNVGGTIVERKNGTSSEKEKLSEPHSDLVPAIYSCPSNKSSSDKEGVTVSTSAEQHHSLQSCIDVDHVSHATSALLASGPRIPEYIHVEELNPYSGIHVKEICPIQGKETYPKISDSQSLATSMQMSASRSDTTSLLSFITNPSPLHSTSGSVISMEKNGRQFQPFVDPLVDSSWQISELQQMRYLPSKDLMPNMRPSVGPRLVSNQVTTCKDRCIREGFVGLPLNSQGELIRLNSGAKFGSSDISKGQNAMQGSINSYPVPSYAKPWTSVDHVKIMKGKFPDATSNQMNRSSWFQERYYHAGEPAISGSDFANLQGFENFGVRRCNASSDKNQVFRHDPNMREASCHGCRDDNRTRNYIDRVNFQAEGNKNHVPQNSIQQTMRLMGTNVTVSRNDKECHGYDDGRMWTDKEVVTDNLAFTRASERPLPQQWVQQQWIPHQSYGMMKNNSFHPSDSPSNLYHMPALAPRLGHAQSNCRPQWISRSGTSLTQVKHCPKVDHFSHPYNSLASLNETSKSIGTSVPGITSVSVGRQIPFMASNPSKVYQHPILNCTHCKHSQSIAYNTSSTFHPHFLYQETSSIQPISPHASPSLPQWLLNTKQQKRTQGPSCSCYSDAVASLHCNNMTHTDLPPLPPSYPTSITNLPVCPPNASQISALGTPSVAQSSFLSPCMTSTSGNAVDTSGRRQNMNSGTNFHFTYLKCLDAAAKNRKRPADKDDVFMKPAKKLSLKTQGDISASAGARLEEQIHMCTPQAKTVTGTTNQEVISAKEGLRTVSLSCSLKTNGEARSGPIKLCAGAKHILKPSQDADKDNSRLTHSKVPFSVGNTSGKGLDLHMRSAEIYRF